MNFGIPPINRIFLLVLRVGSVLVLCLDLNGFYGSWPPSWLNRNIAVLEFFPIILALYGAAR